MFKQTIYSLLSARLKDDGSGTEWKEEPVKAIYLKEGKITRVTTEHDADVAIDDVTCFVRESTGMFDKAGQMLLGGDIVKAEIKVKDQEAREMVLPISWINGAWCIAIEEIDQPIYLTQQNVLEMEKVGNVYQHGKILETTIDEAVFEATEKGE